MAGYILRMWKHELSFNGEMHTGMFLPQFADGRVAAAWGDYDGGGLLLGQLAIVDSEGRLEDARYASEVTGWRVACHCLLESVGPKPDRVWISDQLWTRVASPAQDDPHSFRIYMPDEETECLGGFFESNEIGAIGRAFWLRTHVAMFDARARLAAHAAALNTARTDLDVAVMMARAAGMPWAQVGEGVGISAQAANKRWGKWLREVAEQAEDPAQVL